MVRPDNDTVTLDEMEKTETCPPPSMVTGPTPWSLVMLRFTPMVSVLDRSIVRTSGAKSMTSPGVALLSA